MNLADIAKIRLISQQIAQTKFEAVKDIVAWMGAMQAQDYAMVKWAIGVRLPNATDQVIQTAIANGEIIRTHLLRPTWHFVSADDICWMLQLTAPQIKASLKSRHKELELPEAIFTKSNTIIEKVLHDGKHLTREELINKLAKAKIATDENRASHLLLRAELDGIACSGATEAGKQTYEFIISYKDRSASLPVENHNKTVSNNGIFRPVIVVNGQVIGIWKRNFSSNPTKPQRA